MRLSATITTPAQITVMAIMKIAANIKASLFIAQSLPEAAILYRFLGTAQYDVPKLDFLARLLIAVHSPLFPATIASNIFD
jgi:hypothetical protein